MKLAIAQNKAGIPMHRDVTARTARGMCAVERSATSDAASVAQAFQPAGSGDFPVARFGTRDRNVPGTRRQECLRYQRGFTLAETLAALVFMAIVIPAAVEAVHIASGAGEIAVRKGEAAHVADRVLDQSLVMTNWSTGPQSGVADEGSDEFHWTLKSQNWPQDTMELLTATVTFSTQGREYSVELSTLASLQTQTTPLGTQGKMP